MKEIKVFAPKDVPVTTDNIYTEELSILGIQEKISSKILQEICVI